MKRIHRMPFGAEVDGDATRFRLWAPAARRVELMLAVGGGERVHALDAVDGGWFEKRLEDVGAGVRYAYRIDGATVVPDPASRANPDDVHGRSEVVDATAYDWRDAAWRGRRWEEAVVYELHVGAFTPDGTFAAVASRFDHLLALGVTAIELMPLADFPGARNWGYDGVLPFAPDASYGKPDDLKRLIDAAHARGLMVLLDVVYNHFGPEGNYLRAYAPQFFTDRHRTPWGAAIDFDGATSRTVRDFFIHNACYWLEEFHFDGLRLDAVHAIADETRPDLVDELMATVRARFGEQRHVHVVLENDRNEARRLVRDSNGAPALASAQWNDDFHHALHVLVTGERDGYYADYADAPLERFACALAEGFVYQGEASPFRGGARRGEPSRALPPPAFVAFAQNHDQIGNRALGERLHRHADPERLRTALACMLLAPQIPLLFMGEEFAASSPFLFFCDFGTDLAAAVTRGRREEFARFARFSDPDAQAAIPDPNAATTFYASKLDWREAEADPGSTWLAFYRACLEARHRHSGLVGAARGGGSYEITQGKQLRVAWPLADGRRLTMLASFEKTEVERSRGETIYAWPTDVPKVVVSLEPRE